MVDQVRMFGGRWSMKISHSASPRNRSSRNSRSVPATGNEIAGADGVARATSSTAPAMEDPATESATDVIWHRLNRVFPATKDRIGSQVASHLQGRIASQITRRNRVRSRSELC